MARDIRSARTLFALTLAVVGCAPNVYQTMLGARADPAGRAGDVELWSEKVPECPFDEIAIITARQAEFGTGSDDVLEALRRRAWELGAHVVLGLEVLQGAGEFREPGHVHGGYRGTAIRFSDPACRQ
ncbi:MAG: hypothetical protein ACRELV_00575 [Longimicrobiales bacterium]